MIKVVYYDQFYHCAKFGNFLIPTSALFIFYKMESIRIFWNKGRWLTGSSPHSSVAHPIKQAHCRLDIWPRPTTPLSCLGSRLSPPTISDRATFSRAMTVLPTLTLCAARTLMKKSHTLPCRVSAPCPATLCHCQEPPTATSCTIRY
jgi:hypothetical protein